MRGASLVYADLKWLGSDRRGELFMEVCNVIQNWDPIGEAILINAWLDEANLNGAAVTAKQLAEAKSLRGATMPDGTKHE